ncbi:hypothetical protein [Jidongwangia harbinensis]|uniref:hypothetical protein n=1 Tax=Jidongwangia harbinensis TaxID=2878561 RepID=UPI001CDA4FF5|nr:hypothetical protein [Jidongwangia harbinensis]MCA2212606.1 hypothetical protein [Jidongwangia harbinensis]
MRAITITGAVISAVLMTGCSAGVEQVAGDAVPAGGQPAASASPSLAAPSPAASAPAGTAAVTSAPASRPTSSPPTATTRPVRTTSPPRTLGPAGLGPLKLGMTRKQAEATGLLEGYEVADYLARCGVSKVRGTSRATVFIDPSRGVSYIALYGTVRTPEGIRLGSSVSAVRRAYPDWEFILGDSASGEGAVRVPGNSNAGYQIDIEDGKVSYLALSSENQRCTD